MNQKQGLNRRGSRLQFNSCLTSHLSFHFGFYYSRNFNNHSNNMEVIFGGETFGLNRHKGHFLQEIGEKCVYLISLHHL